MHWMRPELPCPARCVVASLTTKVTAIGRFSDRYPVTRTAAEGRKRPLFQVTAGGGQIDITEQHKKQLQEDIAEYQRLIEELQIVATGAIPLSKKTFDIK